MENYSLRRVTVGLGQCWSGIKAGPTPHSVIHSSCLRLPGNEVSAKPFHKLFFFWDFSAHTSASTLCCVLGKQPTVLWGMGRHVREGEMLGLA